MYKFYHILVGKCNYSKGFQKLSLSILQNFKKTQYDGFRSYPLSKIVISQSIIYVKDKGYLCKDIYVFP